jgi:hypothetical protein
MIPFTRKWNVNVCLYVIFTNVVSYGCIVRYLKTSWMSLRVSLMVTLRRMTRHNRIENSKHMAFDEMTVEGHENVYVCTLSQPRFEPDTIEFRHNLSQMFLSSVGCCRLDIKSVTVFTEGRTALVMNVSAFHTKQTVRDSGLSWWYSLAMDRFTLHIQGLLFSRNVGNCSPVDTAYRTNRIGWL